MPPTLGPKPRDRIGPEAGLRLGGEVEPCRAAHPKVADVCRGHGRGQTPAMSLTASDGRAWRARRAPVTRPIGSEPAGSLRRAETGGAVVAGDGGAEVA